MESVINDVELLDLAVIPTDGGPVMHMMRPASPLFGEIGEVYFSEVEPGCVKAWKCHTRQTQRFAVPVGQLRSPSERWFDVDGSTGVTQPQTWP